MSKQLCTRCGFVAEDVIEVDKHQSLHWQAEEPCSFIPIQDKEKSA